MKKAKLNYTKNGYSYIKCSAQDCLNWGGACICDNCNEFMNKDVYLIFILGRAYCQKCFDEWAERSSIYPEDLALQKERHIDFYKAYGFDVK